jgi:5-methylcytosine-specific restriction endonuclease McrA
MRQVILVAGPPCAGKTSYVQANARPGDHVLDQDQLGARAMADALRAVATMTTGTAWVIRCSPGPTRRAAFARQLGATDVVLLLPDRATLDGRAAHRPGARQHLAAVAQWLRDEAADQAPEPPRQPAPRVDRRERLTPAQRRGRHGRPARRVAAQTLAVKGRICGICGHPGASDSDHIVPLDQGGDPLALWNRQPAHGKEPCYQCPPYANGKPRRCNQSKGNTVTSGRGQRKPGSAQRRLNTSEAW